MGCPSLPRSGETFVDGNIVEVAEVADAVEVLNTTSTQKLLDWLALLGKTDALENLKTPLLPSSPSASARTGPFTTAEVK